MAFFYIRSPAEMPALDVLQQSDVIGVDLETAGENGLIPQRSRIRLIQLATLEDCFVVDLDRVDAMPRLQPLLEDDRYLKVFHHAKFDVKHLLYHQGIAVQHLFCTMLASQLLAFGKHGVRHSLAAVAERYLGERPDKTLQDSDWSGDLTEEQVQYAAADAQLLPRLHAVLDVELTANKLRRVSQLEFRTVLPVAAMENRGVRLDLERWNLIEKDYRQRCQTLEADVLQELHSNETLPGMNTLNLNAPEQVKQALLDRGLDITGTSDAQLRPFVSRYPFVDKFLTYRHLNKILSSTMRPFREAVMQETGRIHPHYHQIASASGRFACSEPNIQQVPREREVRACFVPEPGYKFIVADYSQVELRVAAGLSDDKIMLEAYRDGQDLHRLTAALTMDKDVDHVSKEERQAAKAINFGLIYAMGARGLQQSAKSSYGVEMSLEDAERFRDRYFRNYQGIQRWQRELERDGRRRGFVRTRAGRIRSYSEEKMRVTELFNVPVQGTAAEGLKSALCIFGDRAREEGLDAAIVAIIHDEIILEVREDQVAAAQKTLETAMVDGIRWLVPNVPFAVEAQVGDSWAVK